MTRPTTWSMSIGAPFGWLELTRRSRVASSGGRLVRRLRRRLSGGVASKATGDSSITIHRIGGGVQQHTGEPVIPEPGQGSVAHHSGIQAAYRLRTLGSRPCLFERSNRKRCTWLHSRYVSTQWGQESCDTRFEVPWRIERTTVSPETSLLSVP